MSERCDPCDLDGLRRRLAVGVGPEAADSVRIREIVIDDNALGILPDKVVEYSSHKSNVLVAWDDRPMLRGRDDLKPAIRELVSRTGLPLRLVEFPRDLHTTDDAADLLLESANADSVIVGVGSGNLTDTCKHARWRYLERTGRKMPLISLPTANSVNAASSSLAIILVSGVKRSVASLPPEVILCDLPTLASAPAEMQRAGLGDMMARCVAPGDWYLAHVLGMDDTYTEIVYRMMDETERLLLREAEAIGQRTTDGTRILAEALLLAGLVLSAANQTAPLSGWEHVISHYLDLVGLARGRPLAFHGAQVGVGAIVAASGYALFLERACPADLPIERVFPDPATVKTRIDEHFGPLDPDGGRRAELWSDCRQKLADWNGRREQWRAFCADWQSGVVQEQLRKLVRPPETVRSALAAAGAPTRFDQLDPPADESLALDAIRHAHLVRRRFTLGDLLNTCGLLHEIRYDQA